MDNNNFGNDFYGSKPQKPFTEKTNADSVYHGENAGDPQTFDYEPQQPLLNRTEDTAPNSENAPFSPEQQSTRATQFSSEPQTPAYNAQNYPNQNRYVQQPQQTGFGQAQPLNNTVYGGSRQNTGNNQSYGGYAPNSYQSYGESRPIQQPTQNPNVYSQQPQFSGGYPQPTAHQPAPQKNHSGKGLIAVIIVLSLLLVASIVGLLVFVFTDKAKSKDFSDKSNPQFSFTLPQGGYDNIPDATAAPQTKHDESDYSDKANPDYKGLDLESKPKDADKNDGYTAEYAFNKTSDSVVGVLCYSDKADDNAENTASQGSGIIITEDGYVVTNAHVVGNSKTMYAIRIVTADGKKYSAGVVGVDSRTDIAVLKMDDAKDLSPAKFGDSEAVELGEDIIVIGNPGGLDFQNSLTKGVVSAINRESSSKSLVKYIQTDAAINPGNSGGPIVNLYGQVIGIATSKIVSEKYEGMGFAIPSATAKDIVDNLMKHGYVEGRVKIGITGTAVSSSVAEQYGIPQGILVDEIASDGPCANTDLQSEDIITEVDGQEVTTFSQVYEVLENHKEGDKINIKYYRYSDSSDGEIEITLQTDK